MSITSRINEMSSHIEQAYDELQGLGADLTNVNKNIENISMVLDDIYDSMPQVSGEGTSLTLDDTRVGKIKSTLKGNTSQTTYSGKNLLPNDTETKIRNGITITKNSDGTYKVNGTATSDVSEAICNSFIPMSGTWRMLGCPSGGSASTYMLSAYVGYWGEGSPNIDTGNGTNITYTGNVKVRFFIKSGTTCNNLIFKPMLTTDTTATIDNFEPYVGGTASPNPSYPQPINVVSGDNEIVVCGKNLLINEATNQTKDGVTLTKNNDGSVTLNGTATAFTYFDLYAHNNQLLVTENTTYTFYTGTKTKNGIYAYVFERINNSWSQSLDAQKIGTFTPNSSATGQMFRITIVSGTSFSNDVFYPMLVKGNYNINTIGEYEPYQGNTYNIDLPEGMELCKIGNYQDYFAKSDGRNLFDKSTITTSAYLKEDGTLQTGTGAEYITSDFIPVKPNTTYYKTQTLSPRTKFYDKNKQVLDSSTYQDISIGGNAGSFTTPNNAYYFRFTGNVNTSTGININTTMVNEGSSALPWQPYGVGKWYLHKEIGKVVLDGSSNRFTQTFSTDTSGINRYRTNEIPVKLQASGQIANVFCDKLLPKTITHTYLKTQSISVSDAINMFIIYIDDISTYTLAQANNWLRTNNLEVYYVLSTPTNEEITYQPLIDQLNLLEKAMSKEGQTNISQVNNDLPFIISASALKEWQENTSLNSTLSMVSPLSLGNTLNTQENDIQPIEVDNIEPLEEEENEES